jgi:hypothetical protein
MPDHDDIEPTEDEARFIAALRRCLAKKPNSAWLFAADSGLYVMRKDAKREHAVIPGDGGVDPAYILGDKLGRDIDGGDW